MRCTQCKWCDALDYNKDGLYCMISWPVPKIQDGRCERFDPVYESTLIHIHGIKEKEAAAFREQLLKWKDEGEAPRR